jgi:hypothetical protein
MMRQGLRETDFTADVMINGEKRDDPGCDQVDVWSSLH